MSESSESSQLIPGSWFLGKYVVEKPLGVGGMGVVFAATHAELQDHVAIKLLRSDTGQHAEVVARFLREARAAARLRCENVVRVFDVGRTPEGEPYMIMELLEGHDLASGPLGPALPVETAVEYVVQTCDAMVVAHELGMVHRDLKPANLFLTTDRHGVPTVKVLDFGISKFGGSEPLNVALTHAGAVMGSPLYMAPEQVRSARDVDARADIWSLGAILFELLTGQPPFLGETLGAVFTAVATDTPPPVSSLRPEVPPGLDSIVARCLEKSPASRFQSALELQLALLAYGGPRVRARQAMRGSVAPPQGATLSRAPPHHGHHGHPGQETGTAWSETGSRAGAAISAALPPARRALHPGLIAATGLGVVVLVALFAGVVVTQRASAPASASAEPLALSAAAATTGASDMLVATALMAAPPAAAPSAAAPSVAAPLMAAPSVAGGPPTKPGGAPTARPRAPGAPPAPTLAPAAAPATTAPATTAPPQPGTPTRRPVNPLDIDFR